MKRRYLIMTLLVSALAAGSACNIFKPFDSPSEGEQALSVARACFDRGDFECAKENYAKVTGDLEDQAKAELAFVTLEKVGAGMGGFLKAFGGGDVGGGITSLANTMSKDAGEELRNELFGVYQVAMGIESPELKSFARFVTGLTLTAELLAEASAGTGALKVDDLAADATQCNGGSGAVTGGCALDTNCQNSITADPGLPEGDDADGLSNADGVIDISQSTLTSLDGVVNTRMVYGALREALAGLDGIGGDSGGGTAASLTSDVDAMLISPDLDAAALIPGAPSREEMFARCFRQILLQQGIGG